MDIEQIRDYCLSLREDVEECMPFDEVNLVYKVDGKMFALLSLDSNNISLKCDPELAIELREAYDYVTGAFHFNKKHWNGIDRNQAKAEQIRQWITLSFDLVKKKNKKTTI